MGLLTEKCLADPDIQEHPVDYYHALHERPIYYDANLRFFICSTYRLMREILRDTDDLFECRQPDARRSEAAAEGSDRNPPPGLGNGEHARDQRSAGAHAGPDDDGCAISSAQHRNACRGDPQHRQRDDRAFYRRRALRGGARFRRTDSDHGDRRHARPAARNGAEAEGMVRRVGRTARHDDHRPAADRVRAAVRRIPAILRRATAQPRARTPRRPARRTWR